MLSEQMYASVQFNLVETTAFIYKEASCPCECLTAMFGGQALIGQGKAVYLLVACVPQHCVVASDLSFQMTLLCRQQRGFAVVAAASGGGKRITQNEFTDKAWQSIIAAPDIAKQVCSRVPRIARMETLKEST